MIEQYQTIPRRLPLTFKSVSSAALLLTFQTDFGSVRSVEFRVKKAIGGGHVPKARVAGESGVDAGGALDAGDFADLLAEVVDSLDVGD